MERGVLQRRSETMRTRGLNDGPIQAPARAWNLRGGEPSRDARPMIVPAGGSDGGRTDDGGADANA